MARSNRGRSPKQKLLDAERRGVALDVYRRGFRGDDAAAEMRRLGYPASDRTVWHRLIQRAIEDLWAPAAEEVRAVELERLDENHKRLEQVIADNLARARKGDKDSINAVLGGVRGQLAIAERRAKSLGIDAPDKHEHTGKGGGPIEVSGLNDEQLASLAGGLWPSADRPAGGGGAGASAPHTNGVAAGPGAHADEGLEVPLPAGADREPH